VRSSLLQLDNALRGKEEEEENRAKLLKAAVKWSIVKVIRTSH